VGKKTNTDSSFISELHLHPDAEKCVIKPKSRTINLCYDALCRPLRFTTHVTVDNQLYEYCHSAGNLATEDKMIPTTTATQTLLYIITLFLIIPFVLFLTVYFARFVCIAFCAPQEDERPLRRQLMGTKLIN